MEGASTICCIPSQSFEDTGDLPIPDTGEIDALAEIARELFCEENESVEDEQQKPEQAETCSGYMKFSCSKRCVRV